MQVQNERGRRVGNVFVIVKIRATNGVLMEWRMNDHYYPGEPVLRLRLCSWWSIDGADAGRFTISI